LKDLTGSETDPEEFFAAMEKNLQRSKMRLIFFLEDSPRELRSIVEFINGQMKDMEVLIVEARQYQQGAARIVVPWVFGFTEEARVAKKGSKPETVGSAGAKGETAFWGGIEASGLSNEWRTRIRDFVKSTDETTGCVLSWQKTCIVNLPGVVPQDILLAIRRDGTLELYLARWEPREGNALTNLQLAARSKFFDTLPEVLEIDPGIMQMQYPQVGPNKWLPKTDQLLELIKQLTTLSRD
jgi:hypothetical protein